jgi:hypothetical protein
VSGAGERTLNQPPTPLQNFLGRPDQIVDSLSAVELAWLARKYPSSQRVRDLAEVEVTAHAMSGHFEPLAKYVEEGGELGSDTRDLLARILRGELRFKRGNRRTYAQRMTEWRAREAVRGFQRHYTVLHGSRGSRADAIRRYLELHPHVNEETLKKYLAKAGGCLSKRELQIIDEVRAEVLAELDAENAAGKLG